MLEGTGDGPGKLGTAKGVGWGDGVACEDGVDRGDGDATLDGVLTGEGVCGICAAGLAGCAGGREDEGSSLPTPGPAAATKSDIANNTCNKCRLAK